VLEGGWQSQEVLDLLQLLVSIGARGMKREGNYERYWLYKEVGDYREYGIQGEARRVLGGIQRTSDQE